MTKIYRTWAELTAHERVVLPTKTIHHDYGHGSGVTEQYSEPVSYAYCAEYQEDMDIADPQGHTTHYSGD